MVAALLAVPFVAAVYRARAAGWVPSGDAGMIGLFARDVLHGHLPRLGTPSTAGLVSDAVAPRHPGPIEFYALALPMAALGPTNGMLFWTAFANGASVLVAAWSAFRRLGPGLGLWAAFACGALAWSLGPAALVDPINSDAGAVPLLGLAVLAWAVAAGDRRLLPLLALWSAYYSQLHLGNLPLGLALTTWALAWPLAGWALPVVRRRRWRRGRRRTPAPPIEVVAAGVASDPSAAAPDGPSPARSGGVAARWWPWALGALALTLVLWAPVLVDAAAGHPSNLRLIWEYGRLDDRSAVGWRSGLRQAGHALSPRAVVLRNGLQPVDLRQPLSTRGAVGAVAVVLGLAAVVARHRRRRPELALLAGTALAFAAAGAVVGAQVPTLQVFRLGYFRWEAVVSALAVVALGAAVLLEVSALRVARRPLVREWARLFGAWLVIGITVLGAAVAGPKHGREDDGYAMERRISAAVLPSVVGKEDVLLVPYGPLASRSLAMPLALDLEAHGHHVTVPDFEADNYGDHRRADRTDPDVVVVLGGSVGQPKPLPGPLLLQFSMDTERRAAVLELSEQARSSAVRISSEGPALARAAGVDPGTFALWVQRLPDEPARYLRNETALRLFQAGYLDAPQLDRSRLAELLDPVHRSLWSQDTVQVTILTPEQYRATYGAIR
ncbi:hypothetical protein KSP35_22240 [Aquihabitans sp. G128]|uniref:hypothetical protein n=1 Tax=Aquihabitans sp. G128 TaxID=2849779 RepID=UPI001C23128B|nr:hypothetical protein [Aquihabitans sp. G128]QXC60999.1 hypothetical protein KSP35_22240 [Aquihabitans sp. G128]